MEIYRQMKRIALAAALGLLTCNCAQLGQMIRDQEAAACTSYGFQPGTESFANCLLQVDQARLNRAQSISCTGSGNFMTCN